MKRKTCRYLGLFGIALLLCSCMMRNSRPTRIFILTSPDSTSAPLAVAAQVDSVKLPAYLQRWELVSRLSEQEIKIHDFAQWGHLLSEAIGSAIQESLRLPTNQAPLDDQTMPRLKFSFQRFEGNKRGTFTVKGHCRLTEAKTARELPLEFSFSFLPDNDEALVAAHQEALRRIIAILQEQITQP